MPRILLLLPVLLGALLAPGPRADEGVAPDPAKDVRMVPAAGTLSDFTLDRRRRPWSYRAWERAFIALSAADVATTWALLENNGREKNPLLPKRSAGVGIVVGAKTIGIVWTFRRARENHPVRTRRALKSLTLLQAAVVAHNIHQLTR